MISILTPTYNRGNLLYKIYESLLNQTEEDFEWVVIDDGSIDDTKKIVQQMIEEEKIKITYKYKENGGKHKALNVGIGLCKGELIVFLDSDDYFVKTAIETYNKKFNKIKDDDNVAGVSGLRVSPSKKIIGTTIKGDIEVTSLEYRYKYKVLGDKQEAFKKNILEKFMFPEFEDEKFMPEAVVFNRIADKGYKLLWTDIPTCICEYREDGLTAQREKIFIDSWKGYSIYMKEIIFYKDVLISLKLKLIINYILMSMRYKKNLFQVFSVKDKV